MIALGEIIGQRRARELLLRVLRTGRVPHALLFQGPEGVGKSTVARAFAALLLCGQAEDPACGRCDDCRLLVSGNHPDFLNVTRLPKKPGSSGRSSRADAELRTLLVVDQIRELAQIAALAPRRATRRVFLIDPADRMNAEAQNALLKTLEEPPGRAVIVLIAARPHQLLPTVRSRCFTLRFGALRPRELAARLEQRGVAADEALARAALAEGRPGRALSLDIELHRGRRDELMGWLERLARSSAAVSEIPTMAAGLAGKTQDALADNLDLLEALLRDAARAAIQIGDSGLVHVDVLDQLADLGRRLGVERAAALVSGIDRLRGQLRLNLNRTLVAESLLAAVAGGPLP